MSFALRLPVNELETFAKEYSYPLEDKNLDSIAEAVASRGFLLKPDLIEVGRWKSPRSAGRISANTDRFVQKVTALALSADDEMSRVIPLTSLFGVGWPTASVILHFFHADRYPILDFRALWTLTVDVPPQYSFEFWLRYVEYARGLADEAGLSMRELDKALWEYSKRNQVPRTP